MNFKALCFVDMPFGQKADLKSGVVVDQIYNAAIKPLTEECGLQTATAAASEEMVHKLKGRGRSTTSFASLQWEFL